MTRILFLPNTWYNLREDGRNITLLRFNGDHGIHKNHRKGEEAFSGVHIHKATAEALNAGEAIDHYAEKTDKYLTYEQALSYFMDSIRVMGWKGHFPIIDNIQLTLWSDK